jgi:hypothetical protein
MHVLPRGCSVGNPPTPSARAQPPDLSPPEVAGTQDKIKSKTTDKLPSRKETRQGFPMEGTISSCLRKPVINPNELTQQAVAEGLVNGQAVTEPSPIFGAGPSWHRNTAESAEGSISSDTTGEISPRNLTEHNLIAMRDIAFQDGKHNNESIGHSASPSMLDTFLLKSGFLGQSQLKMLFAEAQNGLGAVMVILIQPMLLFSCWFRISMSGDSSDPFTQTPGGTTYFFFTKITSRLRHVSVFMAFCSISLAVTSYLSFLSYHLASRKYNRLALVLAIFTVPLWITLVIETIFLFYLRGFVMWFATLAVSKICLGQMEL